MKNILLAFFAIFLFSCSATNSKSAFVKEIKEGKIMTTDGRTIPIKNYDDPEGMTFFIVRHAEKELNQGDDPALTTEGTQRANRLAKILANVPVTLAASTNYQRTTQTANPVVRQYINNGEQCDISVYNANDMPFFFDDILKKRKGQKVLVVGHSNTVPGLLNLLTGKEVYTDIPESDYENFYIVTYRGHGDAEVMEMKY